MSTKQQLIEQVCQLLIDGAGVQLYGPASTTITAQDRKFLESATNEFLESKLLQLKHEQIRIAAVNSPEVQRINQERQRDHEHFQREMAWNNIFRTVLPGGKVAVDNAANRGVIESWLHPHESLSQAVFAKAIADTPRLIDQLVVQSSDVLDPRKQAQAATAQAEEDKQVFQVFVRANGFSENDANFSLTKSVLGSGFNRYQLEQAVTSNALRLAQASQQELAQYAQDAAEVRQEYLRQASPTELRAEANRESEQFRIQAQRQQIAAQIEAREQLDAQQGYPTLPTETNDGQKIDRAYLLRLADTNIKQYKLFCNRYGFAAVTARINGIR